MNRILKTASTIVFVVLVPPTVFYVMHKIENFDNTLKNLARIRADLESQRKADQAVRTLIKSGHYDKYPIEEDWKNALREDYEFYKMMYRIED